MKQELRYWLLSVLWTSPFLAITGGYAAAHWYTRTCWHLADPLIAGASLLYGMLLASFVAGLREDDLKQRYQRDLEQQFWARLSRKVVAGESLKN